MVTLREMARWRGTRYRPESKGLEMSEKEIPFVETTKIHQDPKNLLLPVVVFIIQWIP